MTEMSPQSHSRTDEKPDRNREIRVALVLYGGVSLAVYENGVTRSFYELVKGEGVFKLLLQLLDADAMVDVVAGTSAGGINGLLLAAALESGAGFESTADLWREHGDFGALLRPVTETNQAESLLSGEKYYQTKLTEAFTKLVEENPGYESPGEMDVFITGTDLRGCDRTYWDSLGNQIDDRSHRVLFHLKHRPGRRYLGMEQGAKRAERIDEQAQILAAVARITSTFPAAFPPFRLRQVPEKYRDAVGSALSRLSGDKRPLDSSHGERAYVDGGVLDNKPFGPAIKAIFYRMPCKLVDRRLFFVEPDPQQFTPLTPEEKEDAPSPVGVVVASLTSIPSHQSIHEDLEALREHNSRIRWLKSLKDQVAKSSKLNTSADGTNAIAGGVYRDVRIDSLTRTLLLETDDAPSAQNEVTEPKRKRLYEDVRDLLTHLASGDIGNINGYDIDYHVRRAFYILYRIYGEFAEHHNDSPKHLTAIRAIGRIIKFFKIVRDALYNLRDRILPRFLDDPNASPSQLLNVFADLLDSEGSPWKDIREQLSSLAAGGASVQTLASREQGPFASHEFVRTTEKAYGEIGRIVTEGPASYAEPPKSILDEMAEILKQVVVFCHGSDDLIKRFDSVDATFFPLEFASGIHTLDEIQVVRISPLDARLGLSSLDPADKVSGDELAHFAGFFRRDWRSNDILWGRLDGICQIINSLLDDGAMTMILNSKRSFSTLFTLAELTEALPNCPEGNRRQVEAAWNDFIQCSEEDASFEELRKTFLTFKKELISAAQHDAVHDGLPLIYEDMYFQDFAWGKMHGEKNVTSESTLPAIAAAAKTWAQNALQAVQNRGAELLKLRIGSQTVMGPRGIIPHAILSEYATQAYLMFLGMLMRSLEGSEKKKRLLESRRFRLPFCTLPLFLYNLLRMMRTERRLFTHAVTAISAVLLTLTVTGILTARFWWSALSLVAFVFLVLLFNWICRFRHRK